MSDFVITPSARDEILAAARQYRDRVGRPLEPDGVEVFGASDDGRLVFKVTGRPKYFPKPAAGPASSLFSEQEAEERFEREEAHREDWVYVWANEIPRWALEEIVNPPARSDPERRRAFLEEVRASRRHAHVR